MTSIVTRPLGGGALFVQDTREPTGFVDRAESTISFIEGSPVIRTFTIAPTGALFSYYIYGTRYDITTSKSIQIENVNGTHFIYFDETKELQVETAATALEAEPPRFLIDYAYVAAIYWDVVNQQATYVGDERHGITMDGFSHWYLHVTQGTRFVSGFVLSGTFSPVTIAGSPLLGSPQNPTDEDIQFEISAGSFFDEDLHHDVVNVGNKEDVFDLEQRLAPATKLLTTYRSGALGIWTKRPTVSAIPLLYSGDGSGYVGANGLPPYNAFGGSPQQWTLTEVPDKHFFFVHYLATNDIYSPVRAVQGVTYYEVTPTGAAEAQNELAILGGLPFQEFFPIASVIFQASTSFTNTPKCVAVKTSTGADYVDFRPTQLLSSVTGASSATNHANLAGLELDTHPQYTTDAYDGLRDSTGNTRSASGRSNTIRFLSGSGVDATVITPSADADIDDVRFDLDIAGLTAKSANMEATDQFIERDPTGSPIINKSVTGQEIANGVFSILGVTLQAVGGTGSPGDPILFLNDVVRGKTLSVTEVAYTWAEAALTDNNWMQIGSASDAVSGHIMPYDGTIIGVQAHCADDNSSTKGIVLFINAVSSGTLGSFPGTGADTSFSSNTLNINFSAGDKLRLRANIVGGTIEDVVINLRVKWRPE